MPAGDETAPGVFEQFGRTRASFSRLIGAHFTLLRAELAEIVGQLKVLGVQAGVALVLALFVANMVYVGGFLFVGEWLFGSLGWGLAHGLLFGLGLIVLLLLAMLGVTRGPVLGSLLVVLLVAIGLALLLASNIPHYTAAHAAQQFVAPLDGPAVVAALTGALVLGLLMLVLLWRAAGAGGGIAGLILGALVGAGLGYLIGSPWTLPPAVAFAITIGLLVWPLVLLALAWPGLDPGERFGRLYPRQTIATTKETKTWLENQWRSRQKKLVRK